MVVLLSIDEFERLNISDSGFWDSLMSFRKMINSEESAFFDQDLEDLRDPSCGREVEWDE